MKKGLLIFSLAIALTAASGVAQAVTSTGSTTVSATVPAAISITVPAAHALTVTPGGQAVTPLSIGVKSNTTWSMTVYKSDDLKDGAKVIPSSQLVYTSSTTNGTGVAGDTEFDTVSSPTGAVSSGTSTGEAGATVTVNYKLATNYDDEPGNYSSTHTYIAAAP